MINSKNNDDDEVERLHLLIEEYKLALEQAGEEIVSLNGALTELEISKEEQAILNEDIVKELENSIVELDEELQTTKTELNKSLIEYQTIQNEISQKNKFNNIQKINELNHIIKSQENYILELSSKNNDLLQHNEQQLQIITEYGKLISEQQNQLQQFQYELRLFQTCENTDYTIQASSQYRGSTVSSTVTSVTPSVLQPSVKTDVTSGNHHFEGNNEETEREEEREREEKRERKEERGREEERERKEGRGREKKRERKEETEREEEREIKEERGREEEQADNREEDDVLGPSFLSLSPPSSPSLSLSHHKNVFKRNTSSSYSPPLSLSLSPSPHPLSLSLSPSRIKYKPHTHRNSKKVSTPLFSRSLSLPPSLSLSGSLCFCRFLSFSLSLSLSLFHRNNIERERKIFSKLDDAHKLVH